jgi:hypothetical protein
MTARQRDTFHRTPAIDPAGVRVFADHGKMPSSCQIITHPPADVEGRSLTGGTATALKDWKRYRT